MQAALWFKRIALIASILALCLVSLGAYVRLSDAGLGCPDWPGCYGTLTVPQSEDAIRHAQQAYPDSQLNHGKAWKEMAHRYVAGILGILVLVLAVTGWLGREQLKTSPWVSSSLLLLVVFQALLGMWTVTMLLKPIIVSAHLIGGMSTLALLVWIAYRHWGQHITNIEFRVQSWARVALLVLFIQIFLGGWTSTNYAALTCTDFPTCYGKWVPDLDFDNAFHWGRDLGMASDGLPLKLNALATIQWVHRIGAFITLIYMLLFAWLLYPNDELRTNAKIMLGILLLQILVGVANLLMHLPLPLAVTHNFLAALLLVTIVIINAKITKLR